VLGIPSVIKCQPIGSYCFSFGGEPLYQPTQWEDIDGPPHHASSTSEPVGTTRATKPAFSAWGCTLPPEIRCFNEQQKPQKMVVKPKTAEIFLIAKMGSKQQNLEF
jgi:hypothetical protein